MRKLFVITAAIALICFIFTSCAATKRDCQGNKHYRLKNGIYL